MNKNKWLLIFSVIFCAGLFAECKRDTQVFDKWMQLQNVYVDPQLTDIEPYLDNSYWLRFEKN